MYRLQLLRTGSRALAARLAKPNLRAVKMVRSKQFGTEASPIMGSGTKQDFSSVTPEYIDVEAARRHLLQSLQGYVRYPGITIALPHVIENLEALIAEKDRLIILKDKNAAENDEGIRRREEYTTTMTKQVNECAKMMVKRAEDRAANAAKEITVEREMRRSG